MPDEILSIYDKIKDAEERGDLAEKAKLKSKLYYITPAVILNPAGHRSYDDILSFTGIMPIDIDHIENAVEVRNSLFINHKFIIAAWLSSSGKGVRALVRIPEIEIITKEQAIEKYKSYFWGLYKVIGSMEGFDTAPQNSVLPLYLSPDKDILIRSDCEVFDRTGENTRSTNYKNTSKNILVKYNFSPSRMKKLKKNIISAIDKITDNGHPQLRAAAFSLGGYVGAGYIRRSEAIKFINELIDDNDYLSQKANIYKQTALTMIDEGIKKPIRL
jgi:hypothetical protein